MEGIPDLPDHMLMGSIALLMLSIAIAAVEILLNREIYSQGDWLGWETSRLAFSRPVKPVERLLSVELLSGPNIQILRLVLAISCIVGLAIGLKTSSLLGALILVQLLHNYRTPTGRDGSDQMTMVVLVGLFLCSIDLDGRFATLAVWFVGLQLALSYASSGLAKLSSRIWLTTNALSEVFNTVTYGRRTVSLLLRRFPAVSFAGAYLVIAWQALFPISLILPEPVFYLFLLIGFGFHLAIAVVMGLNTFLFSFLAAYPFIVELHARIGAHFSG